jgi:hypothetical protein
MASRPPRSGRASRANRKERREMRVLRVFFAAALVLALASPLLAQNNNPCPGDKEYQFNIIGVKYAKKTDLTDNNGHRIFVPLNGKTQIYMTGDTDTDTTGLQCGNNFDVLDANGTDGSAWILVPCDPLDADNLDPEVCFEVYATPLGTPGGSTDVNVYCDFDDTCLNCDIDGGDCATGDIDFTLEGHSGKPRTQNITSAFRASGCIDVDGSLDCNAGDIMFNNEWIFNIEQLLYYYWDYDNHGNKLVNIRFCNSEDSETGDCGGGSIVPSS